MRHTKQRVWQHTHLTASRRSLQPGTGFQGEKSTAKFASPPNFRPCAQMMTRHTGAMFMLSMAFAASAVYAATPLSSTQITTPVSVPLQAGMRSNSTFLNLNDPTFPGANATGNQPTQVHLSPAGTNSLNIMWATGQYQSGQGALTALNPNTTASTVMYGTSASSLTSMASGSSEIYNQIYNLTVPGNGGATSLNYTSPVLHTVVLTNLAPNTKYFYQVGDGTTFSSTFNFTSLAAPSATTPQRFLLIADWGLSQNSSVTLQHILQSAANTTTAPAVLYIADFCYADTWYTNGSVLVPNAGLEGAISGTYQPVWDAWQRFIQPLVSSVPMLACTGNHEIEAQSDASDSMFKSVQARWKMPSNASNSPSYFFHSQAVGPAHVINLSPYVDYTPGSAQWQWLAEDLSGINRSVTPWVIVNIHNPWYTTDTSYKEFEQMRVSMEPLTYRHGVDLFYYGHVHAYERTHPMYDYTIDPCGAVHITIGDGGNSEGLNFLANNKMSPQYEDTSYAQNGIAGGCPTPANSSVRPAYIVSNNPTISDPWTFYKRTLTFQGDGNSTGTGNPAGYCYKEQPAWSAYREPSFGHGTLDVINATTALWQWHRNQDNNLVTADAVYIVRNTALCPNKANNWPIVTTGLVPTTEAAPAPAGDAVINTATSG
ncbi:TPA: hypothetical protein ACH3X1_001874 [Trebouxia sp. C0004]